MNVFLLVVGILINITLAALFVYAIGWPGLAIYALGALGTLLVVAMRRRR